MEKTYNSSSMSPNTSTRATTPKNSGRFYTLTSKSLIPKCPERPTPPGNPTTYYNGTAWTFTWEHGRQLATMSDGTTTWTNTYNSDGLRTSRTDGTTTYTYIYENGKLSAIKRNDLNMWITYDDHGPVTIQYGVGVFHYVTNPQGDVMAIVDANGDKLVEYTYDAWGKVTSITGDFAYNLGIHNPILYRGYIYDHETQLYYCQSRYYDPEIGRFLNADAFASTGQGFMGNNLFAYCNNNPICLVDSSGNKPTEAVDIDGDGEIDYYRYDYVYSYTTYLPYHGYSYEATASGSVYIFPETSRDYFQNEENIPKGFNKYTDLLVADIPTVENTTFYAYQAQHIPSRSYSEIAEILRQYDTDFSRGFDRSTESIVSEWHYHMFFGGRLDIPRSANVDFDHNAEGKGFWFYFGKAFLGM